VKASDDDAATLVASATAQGAQALGVSASPSGAAAPGGVSATAAGARTPAASATGDGASVPAANASPSGASAPGAPDTWTWVWNWTGACLTAPASAPRAGWNWVWNWTCAAAADPAAGTSPSPGVPGLDATPIAVLDSPASPAADTPIALAPAAHPRAAPSSTRRTAAGHRPPARPSATGAVDATRLFFSAPVPSRVVHLAPRVRSASPAARANPVRERGRRGGADPSGPQLPFAPDPVVPLMAGSSTGGGGTGFVLLLTMALLAAVSLADPAGLSWRVATATRSVRDRIVRRIDRPG
jgi:hypothetical protein